MPDETPVLTRKVFTPTEHQFTPGERSMVAWISTDAVDHERDVVVSAGIDYKTYFMGKTPEEGNPCVLAFHDLGRWPLGRCEWVKIKQSREWNGLYAKTVFDEDPETETVWRKIKSGSLRGISIGFRPPNDLKPGEWGPPTREELLRRPDWMGAERIIRRCVLLEYSVCSLPMNPQALVAAVNKGVHRPVFSFPKANSMATVETATKQLEGKSPTQRFDVVRKSAAGSDDSAAVTPADARVMIGLSIPSDVAATLAVPGGEPPEELHVTLCYLGRAIEIGTRAIGRVQKMCRSIASFTPPLKGSISGVGRFSASSTSDGKDVVYASADLPDLPEFRQRLAENVRWEGVEYSRAHGFTPHVTLEYVDTDAESPVKRIAPIPVVFNALSLWVDGERTDFPFDTNAFACDGPVGYVRSAGEIEAKAMNDDDEKDCKCGKSDCEACQARMNAKAEDDDEKACECGKADCKCGMAEGSAATGGATVKPKADAEDDEDDEDDVDTKAMTGHADVESPEEDADETEADEEEENEEEGGGFKRGDHVRIKSPHYNGCGVVEGVHKSGLVPHADNDLMASKADPAARVRCHKAMGDGHVPTEFRVAVKCAHMTKLGTPLTPPSKKSAPAPAKKTVRTEPIVEPLPTIVAKSDQEVRNELIAKLNQMLSPEGFRRIAREEAERAAGFV